MTGRGLVLASAAGALVTSLAGVIALGGCTAPPSTVSAPRIDILGKDVVFALDAPPLQRLAAGFFNHSLTGLTPGGDGPGVLHAVTPPGNALLGRRLDAPLAATPYLVWNWRILPPRVAPAAPPSSSHPLQLVIGFAGGSWGPAPYNPDLPPFQRALVIAWAYPEWEAGATEQRGAYARTVAHGGPPDGAWWEDILDLAELHSRFWPDIETRDVRISFVAVATRKSWENTEAEIAGLALTQ